MPTSKTTGYFFKSEPKQKLSSKCLRVWDIKKTKELLGPNTCRLLPFIHALTGCDTTSLIYGISKGAALKKLTADQQLKLHAETFLKESTKCDIVAAGEGALVSLYGGIQIENLNLLRFRKFANRVMTSSSFVQVYTPPLQSTTVCVFTIRFRMVKCSCKQNCDTKRCTYRKHGLDCSIGCTECRGMSCTNTSQLTESDLTDAL